VRAEKKLTEAARHYARGGHEPLDDDDLAMLGDAADAMDESVDFYVWPENWDALLLFLASETQWRYAPNGKATGLIYTGVQVVMQMTMSDKSIADQKAAFEGLQVMEGEALRVWSAEG